MNAREAIEVGGQIAQKHKRNVMDLMELGATPEKALDGCIVSLAADIMVALNRAETIKPEPTSP